MIEEKEMPEMYTLRGHRQQMKNAAGTAGTITKKRLSKKKKRRKCVLWTVTGKENIWRHKEV